MLKALGARYRQGRRTSAFPGAEPVLPPRFRGRPVVDPGGCVDGCNACRDACPTGAIALATAGAPRIDLGKCLFCAECARACPTGAIQYTNDYRLATRGRADLVVGDGDYRLAEALGEELRRLLGRSLRLRVVSAGGCNGCEVEVAATGNIVFDASRFGIEVVASPRHADGLIVTGPVTANMKAALLKTHAAIPDPRIVIALGACAIAGGPYFDHPEVEGGLEGLMPVDLFVPGCPPHPFTILDGILRMLGRR